MRWRPALTLAAAAVFAALLGGVGPAWADQLTGEPAPAARLSVSRTTDVAHPAPPTATKPVPAGSTGPPELIETAVPATPEGSESVAAERTVRRAEPPPPPQLAPVPTRPAVVRDAIVRVAVNGAVAGAERSAGRRAAVRHDVLPPTAPPTVTVVAPSGGSSVPGTGGGNGDTDPQATGMAVGSVLLIGVGLIAAGVALVGLRNRRETSDHGH